MKGFIHLNATLVDGENNLRDGILKVEICIRAEVRRLYFNVVF